MPNTYTQAFQKDPGSSRMLDHWNPYIDSPGAELTLKIISTKQQKFAINVSVFTIFK